jgi:hypothetical protein
MLIAPGEVKRNPGKKIRSDNRPRDKVDQGFSFFSDGMDQILKSSFIKNRDWKSEEKID